MRANIDLHSGALAGSNVLLITIDTLRADRVGVYSGAGPRSFTPALDRLAAAGVRFTQAHAHAPLTLPAHTSILTGLVPPSHGVHNNGSAALAASTPTLATMLGHAGYRTGAFVGAFVLDARFGLSRGFDVYDDRVGSDTGPVTFGFAERTADRVTAPAGDWILSAGDQRPTTNDQRPTPWFCWIHLFDPHAPYRAPEQRVADPYDNEVAFADAQIGRLFDRLRGAGQLDRTLVVVAADHGESLGEHGEATHGLFAYEATLHVPLLIAGPSIQPSVVDTYVTQADLVPTILDLVGISQPARVDGQSLVPALRGEAFAHRPIYFEALDANLTRNWAPLTGVIADGWKYIDLPEPELYELGRDQGELHNRIAGEPARATRLAGSLSEWSRRSSAAPSRPPIDADAAARLRALGYTATQADHVRRRQYTTADDPKRLLDLDRRYERALTLTGDRQYGEAARLLQGVISERTDFTVAYLNLASVYLAGGDPSSAVALLERAAGRGVTSPELQGRLGSAYLASGDPRRAAKTLEPIARPDLPGGLESMNTLAVALSQLGDHDRARRLLHDVLARSPRSATMWSNLGLTELAAHRPAAAAEAFEQAVGADPQLGQAWEGLGAARTQSDPAAAIEAWKHAVQIEPRNYDVLFNLAVMLREQGRAAEAEPYIDRFVREAPPNRYARDIEMMRAWK